MNYLARAAIVATIVIGLGTAAFAIAETHRYPSANRIPVVVTPTTAAAVSTATPHAVVPTPTPPAAENPVSRPPKKSSSTKTTSSSTKHPASDSAKKSTPDKNAHDGDASVTNSADKAEPKREVVTPTVRDDGENHGEDTHDQSPEQDKEGSTSD